MTQRDTAQPPHDVESFNLETLIEHLVAYHRVEKTGREGEASAEAPLRRRIQAELAALQGLTTGDEDRERLAALGGWLEETRERLAPVLAERGGALQARSWALDHPHSRLCDDGRVLIVNAIDRDLQGPGAELPLDPGADLASLLVGLEVRDEPSLARQALDRYLRLSGDYEMARLLAMFRVIEALAGARRALRRRAAVDEGDAEQPALLAETMAACRRYLTLAEAHAEFCFPPLVIGVGVVGSGKSRFTRTLVGRLGAVRVCSDVERRRLHGSDPQAMASLPAVDSFSPEATARTYRHLARCAGLLLEAGLPVCVDGTFLRREQRDLLRQQAEARGLPVLLVSFEADEDTLHRRIVKRAGRQGVAVEDSLAVLAHQQAALEPFGDEERLHLLHLDTTAENAAEMLAGLIQEHVRLT